MSKGEMMKRRMGFLILICIMSSGLLFMGNAQLLGAEIMKSKLPGFRIEKARIMDVARELSYASHLSICAEEDRWFATKENEKTAIEALNKKRESGISLKLENTTVEEILNRLILIAPEYAWKLDKSTAIINIYPIHNAPLGWEIKCLQIENRSFREIFVENDMLGLKAHEIALEETRGNLSWLETKVSLTSDTITAREAINQLCKQLKFKARWDVFEVKTWQGARRYLRFSGYDKEPFLKEENDR